METELALETVKAINNLLRSPLGEKIYREKINVLFKTLELINHPIYAISGDEITKVGPFLAPNTKDTRGE